MSRFSERRMSSVDMSPLNQTLDYLRGIFQFFQGHDFYDVGVSKKKSDHCRPKVHHYLKTIDSNSFALEPLGKNELEFSMTGFGADIKQGDFIVINDKPSTITYKVESIEYYLDPPDMWMALLIKYSYSCDEC
jgi:hypothetical protein